MAYGTLNRINGNKNQENLDRHLKLDDPLDSHQKPVKIGDDITGLQLAGKDVKIEGNLTIDGDISVSGEIDGGSNANNLKGNTTIGYPEGDTVAIVGSNIYIGEPQNYGSATGSVAKIGARKSNDTSTDLVLNSREDYVDNLTISVGTSGLSTISTNDGGGAAAHLEIDTDGNLTIDSGGDIILDSADGNFIAKKASVEFSSANSSYAGMILGYTDIGLDEGRAELTLTLSYVVPTDEFSVAFKSPPSGNVEIEIQILYEYGANGLGTLEVGLSTANATSGYSALQDYHEEAILYRGGRAQRSIVRHSWTLTGLTAGSAYEYWVGFKSLSTTGTPKIHWGGDSTGQNPSFIMKATALPATITT
jgi:hypothetical protein